MLPEIESVMDSLKGIVSDVLMDIDEDEIQHDTNIIESIGGDSLDLMDIAVRIERMFKIPFTLEEVLADEPSEDPQITVAFLAEKIMSRLKMKTGEEVSESL